jgi:hypothetical protein
MRASDAAYSGDDVLVLSVVCFVLPYALSCKKSREKEEEKSTPNVLDIKMLLLTLFLGFKQSIQQEK